MNNSTIQDPINTFFSLLVADNSTTKKTVDVSPSIGKDELHQALSHSKKRYALATRITSDGVWSWDLDFDRIDYSSRWKAMIGFKEEEIGESPVEWLVRVHPGDVEKLKWNLANCRQGKFNQFELEYALLHRDGQYRTMHCRCIAATGIEGEVSHLIGSQSDITQQKQIKSQLRYQTNRDCLTKLPDRQLFIAKLKDLSQVKSHSDYLLGILYLDLDRFKNVNHNFGHTIGDRLIVEVVKILKFSLRLEDLIARLGGDEFAILLCGFQQANYPLEVASRIQQAFSEPITVGEHSILVSVSIGIATPSISNDLIESLKNAEIAMHQAKAQGKSCSRVFESELHLANLRQAKSEDDLRQAIEQKQFELYYQPIVRLDNYQLVGFEALIRWRHPERGLVFPGDFIPLAENTGLITPIGWWVLRSACLQMVQWQQEYGASIFISVNVTGKQFSQPYTGDIVAQILTETNLAPSCLKLEITESEIIENIELVLDTVEKLKNLGVQLSMDDFGTGYSSLSYLHCLPVDTLKIDRSFIQGMEQDRHQLELVKTIIKLAEVFNLDLVAEGIETERQCSQLLELGCNCGQGYLFSKPVTSAIATSLLSKI